MLQDANDILRQFDGKLETVRFELQNELNKFDPFDKDKLNNFLELFSDRLIIFQHDFMQHLATIRGRVDPKTEKFTIKTPPIVYMQRVGYYVCHLHLNWQG